METGVSQKSSSESCRSPARRSDAQQICHDLALLRDGMFFFLECSRDDLRMRQMGAFDYFVCSLKKMYGVTTLRESSLKPINMSQVQVVAATSSEDILAVQGWSGQHIEAIIPWTLDS